MYSYDVCNLTTSELDEETNSLLIQATINITGAEGDEEHFGAVPIMSQLGVTAIPAPIDENGRAEGVILRGIAGVDGIIVGGRDTRTASVYASLQPGDTCLHSTAKGAAAQFQAKANRQAIIATKDKSEKTMIFVLDGKNDKVQLAAFGAIIEIDKAKDQVFITNPSGGCSIMMKGDTISLVGKVILGGAIPFALVHSGPGVGTTSIPTPGVFVGV